MQGIFLESPKNNKKQLTSWFPESAVLASGKDWQSFQQCELDRHQKVTHEINA